MPDPDPPPPPRLFTRRKILGTIAASGAAAFTNARWIEPDWLSVTRTTVRCPLLPPSLDGLRVGILCDLHFQPDRDESLLQAAVNTLLTEKPDLITLPGDFIDYTPKVIAPMMKILGKLEAPLGVFGSLGNHDGWNGGREELVSAFERLGFTFLINQHTKLAIRGESLAIAATDHVWLGKPDAARTLRGIPVTTPVIALVHEPDYFDDMSWVRPITLQVSGHTHGGQCRIPGIGYAPVRVKYGEKYLEGIYQKNDSSLFVSRGLGTTGIRVRFACPPEVAILTLRSA